MLSDTLRRATRPIAQFDGLMLDVTDPQRAVSFWKVTLGGRMGTAEDGTPRIVPGPGRPPREILRLRQTYGLLADDARVHIDVRLPGKEPDALLAAGARVVRGPEADPWYVLADQEGNEFCAFPAVDGRPPGMFELVIKCADPHGLARWWSAVLGGQVSEEGEAAAVVGAPEFPWDFMVFDPVAGIDRFHSRMRWHLQARDHDITGLLAMGATLMSEPTGDNGWYVLFDPEGNEFCVTAPR